MMSKDIFVPKSLSEVLLLSTNYYENGQVIKTRHIVENPNGLFIVSKNNYYKLPEATDVLDDARFFVAEFSTSKTLRVNTIKYTIGDDFSNIDKSPNIKFWLAKSTYKGTSRVFFNVESSEQLIAVCEYYGYECPFPTYELELVDNFRTAIRYKSADIYETNVIEEVVLGYIDFSTNSGRCLRVGSIACERSIDAQHHSQCSNYIYTPKVFLETNIEVTPKKLNYREVLNISIAITDILPTFNRYDFAQFCIGYDDILKDNVVTATSTKLPGKLGPVPYLLKLKYLITTKEILYKHYSLYTTPNVVYENIIATNCKYKAKQIVAFSAYLDSKYSHIVSIYFVGIDGSNHSITINTNDLVILNTKNYNYDVKSPASNWTEIYDLLLSRN